MKKLSPRPHGSSSSSSLIVWLAHQPNPHEPRRTLGRSTIDYHVAVLRALFADAVEEGVIRSSPTAGIRVSMPTGDEDEPAKAMTRAELGRLLDELDQRWRLFFEFLAHTGLRISEAIELRWRDLELWFMPRLHVRRQLRDGEAVGPKTAAGRRTIPLAAGMAERLRLLEGPPDALVFTTTTGRQINRSNLWRDVLRPAGEWAGFAWVSFHTFRHTCASLLFRRRQERQAGAGVAGSRRPRLHRADLHPPHGRGRRRGRLPR